MRVLVEHLLFALFEELDGLFALPHQIDDENVEMFNVVQGLHVVLVLGVDEPQALVGIGQDVEDKGRRVLEVHLLVLAQLDHLVHQLPGLVEGALVGGVFGVGDDVREGALQLGQDGGEVLVLDGTVAACHFDRRDTTTTQTYHLLLHTVRNRMHFSFVWMMLIALVCNANAILPQHFHSHCAPRITPAFISINLLGRGR